MTENKCVCCDEIIPEGRQVCPSCESKVDKTNKEKFNILRSAIITAYLDGEIRRELLEFIEELEGKQNG